MRILLDENFPLPLQRRLAREGLDADHVISVNLRGASDSALRRLLEGQDILFLTQDAEFTRDPPKPPVVTVVSRLPQDPPALERVETWCRAILDYVVRLPAGDLFDLDPDGTLIPWTVHKLKLDQPE